MAEATEERRSQEGSRAGRAQRDLARVEQKLAVLMRMTLDMLGGDTDGKRRRRVSIGAVAVAGVNQLAVLGAALVLDEHPVQSA